ncbi:MAG: hypothetical protein ACJ79V_11735 [Myxococcales bacterium]
MRRAVLLPLLLAFAAGAADVCAPGDAPDKYQYLRRLSLDLRGRVPTVEEYEALDTEGDVPRLLIQTWLATDDFRLAMRRYHEAMLWPNLSNLRINDQGANLGAAATAAGEPIYYTPGFRAAIRRGGDVPCGDFEQTHFDPAHPGELRPDPAFVRTVDVNGVTVRQEGYRTISPYWDPTTKAKACAYDLQETAQALHPNGRTVSCSSREADALPECGCGRGLRYCYGPGPAVIPPVLASFREQLGRHVDDVSVGGRPYTDLVLSTDAWENGPLGFWKKNLSPHYSLQRLFAMPDPGEELPERDFTDATFVKVHRTPLHAGVLTLPGYLLRFQTARGRANRFRINFLCNYFVPPAHLETSSSGQCSDTAEDITQRCNCRYCHSELEPLAAHWGLFAIAGTTQMTDPVLFPKSNPACLGATDPFCARFYVTRSDAHGAASFLPYQFADVHPELVQNLEGGPRLVARKAVDSGEFARCATQKVWMLFNNAAMYGDDAGITPALDGIAAEFAGEGYSLQRLALRIVTDPAYRRGR